MIETRQFSALRKEIAGRSYYWKTHDSFTGGIPDVFMSGAARDLWCEGKRYAKLPPVVDLTKTDVTSVLQQNWLKARHAEGRNVSMLVFTDKQGCLLLHGLEWMTPIPRDEFLARAKTRREIADELVKFVGSAKEQNDGSTVQPPSSVRSLRPRRSSGDRRGRGS